MVGTTPTARRLTVLGLVISSALMLVSVGGSAHAGNSAYAGPADTCREAAPATPNPHPCDWPGLALGFAQNLDPKTFADPIEPDGPVEERYFEEGPWSVRVDPEFSCCDSAGNNYAVYRPRHLGVGDIRHPIITWGNGSDGSPEGYDFFLRHMASWGFVVIATREDQTGSGDEILDAARFLVAANADPSSDFFHKLATDRVGAMGHSQGASGAINAMRKSDGLIETTILFHIPENGCWTCPPETPTGESGLDEITWGSVYFVTGSNDPPISSAAGNKWWYEELPDSIPKARGRLVGPSHNDITGQPGCQPGTACFNGVYGYLGYPTAWLMDRLQNDRFARGGFVSEGSGEIFQNGHWDNVVTDNVETPKGKKAPSPNGKKGGPR